MNPVTSAQPRRFRPALYDEQPDDEISIPNEPIARNTFMVRRYHGPTEWTGSCRFGSLSAGTSSRREAAEGATLGAGEGGTQPRPRAPGP